MKSVSGVSCFTKKQRLRGVRDESWKMCRAMCEGYMVLGVKSMRSTRCKGCGLLGVEGAKGVIGVR